MSFPPTSPLRIGPLSFDLPVMQGALSGYSDWPMRAIARRLGVPYTLCEVMLDQFLVQVKPRKKHLRFFHLTDDDHPAGGQLMGAEPEQFAAGAARLVQAGFDAIDINFGCPVRKVLSRCRGGFLLGQPDRALEIIRRTRDTVPAAIPVTVKMRRGIDDSAESRDQFFQILDGAFEAGVAAVAIHGRTVEQRYYGDNDLAFLREVKQHVGDRIILGSGNLFSANDCRTMMQETGVDGVWIARGAIGNPWIFQQIRALFAGQPLPPPPTVHEQREVIREHYHLAEELYGEQRAAVVMRKHGIKYAHLHPNAHQVRAAFTRSQNHKDWMAVLTQHYTNNQPGQYPDPAIHRVN